MVGVGVRVDGVAQGQAVLRGDAAIPLKRADLGIDDSADMRVRASEDVGPASTNFDGFDDHVRSPGDADFAIRGK